MQFLYTLQYIVLKKDAYFWLFNISEQADFFSTAHIHRIYSTQNQHLAPQNSEKHPHLPQSYLTIFFLSKPVQINRILPQSTYCLLHTIIFFFPFLLAIFAHYLYFCIVFLYTLVKKGRAEEDILQLICPYTINNNTIMTGIHDFLLSDINTTAHSLSHKKMGCRAFSPCVSLHPGFSFNS